MRVVAVALFGVGQPEQPQQIHGLVPGLFRSMSMCARMASLIW